jgi:hypothetical protein
MSGKNMRPEFRSASLWVTLPGVDEVVMDKATGRSRRALITRHLATMCLVAMFLTGVISAQERPRIFITDSQAWSAVFSFGVVTGTGVLAAGSSPQTVEVIDDFAKHCPAVTVTSNKGNADYIVLFDRDGAGKAKTNLARADKIAVFSKNGDLVFSGKTRSVANSVKDACVALSNK